MKIYHEIFKSKYKPNFPQEELQAAYDKSSATRFELHVTYNSDSGYIYDFDRASGLTEPLKATLEAARTCYYYKRRQCQIRLFELF